MPVARAEQFSRARPPPELRAGPRDLARPEPGRGPADRQPARRRDRRRRLPGRADAARRALHPQRRAADQRRAASSSPPTATGCWATAGRSCSSRPTATSPSTATARSRCARARASPKRSAASCGSSRFAKPQRLQQGRRQHCSRRRPASRRSRRRPRSVMQGAIEKSNVRAVIEMTRMIEVTRTYTNVAAHAAAAGRPAPHRDRAARRSAGLSS